jgi:hypothetical protein
MKKMGLRLTKLFALATLVLAATASSGSAAAPARPHLLGVVPHNSENALRELSPLSATSSGALPYNGGMVMHTSTSYAIYWFPSGHPLNPTYENTINQYFSDVAAASGRSDNVYSAATQYYDETGPILYSAKFGGVYVDTTSPLPNHCDDGFNSICVTDTDLQAEVQHVLAVNGWHGGTTNVFFVMTPTGVGSCADGTSTECSTNDFCAYHNDFTDSSGEHVIYANEPYEGAGNGCDGPGQGFPNNADADVTINTISHEHNESITDPFGDAWIAPDGEENGDLCAYTYGSPLGTVGGQPYNQQINGHDYSLQQEYSNDDGGCVLRYTPAVPPSSVSLPVVTGVVAEGQLLSTTAGSWAHAPSGYAYQWQRCASNGTGCADIPGATTGTYRLTASDGQHEMRAELSAHNAAGNSSFAASVATSAVVSLPNSTAAPVLSGPAGVGKRLSTTDGSWNTSATFAYQWQRCAAGGGSCIPIAGATAATYALAGADAGHTLDAIVTATNVAGTASSTSAASHQVVAVPRSRNAPRISGKAAVGHRLAAGRGRWTWTPTKFRYQWLRCSASGGRCVAIKKASRATDRVAKKDAGHRLRLRVTATNAAGGRSASSRATARVR